MARYTSSPSIPKYRRQRKHKGDDLAFVELNGQRHYLSKYRSPQSRREYHRLVAEWEANGRQLPVDPDNITVVELCARYWQFDQGYYGPKPASRGR